MGALDTPRTSLGDATYLSHAPDFGDISQEASFQSPSKDGNVLQQLRNGRADGISLRTPRRDPLTDRNNLPPSIGGAEFTPLLKSATRNSVRRRGKENGAIGFATPALDRIDEGDITSLPPMDASIYSSSRNQSFLERSMPRLDSSSTNSTPLAIMRRSGADRGPLQDGNQLSLREQENVIDRIEKENFGLKLKIHFLEEALRKAGPGYSEAALKENTELKVEQVTVQRELHRYKKHLMVAEKDLETCRQQMTELQENAKRKYADESLQDEMNQLRQELEEREADVDELRRKLAQSENHQDEFEKLQDNVEDLEADLRDKDRQLTEREDEVEDLKEKLEAAEEKARDADNNAQEAGNNEQLEEAKETIEELELNIRQLEQQVDELKEQAEDAATQKEKAVHDLEELQEEMADKSVVTKGLSRQIDERVARLQEELDTAGRDYAELEKELTEVNRQYEQARATLEQLGEQQASQAGDQARVQQLEAELQAESDEKNLLQIRNDSLTAESSELQNEVEKLEREVEELEASVAKEREYILEVEKDFRTQYQEEIERLNDEISDLQAEVRERDNLYDNDSEKWETEKQMLEAERHRAEERAAGLQRTIDRLRETEGSLSDQESRLQSAMQSEVERHRGEEAVLMTQVNDLQDALEARQTLLTNLRNELSTARDDLRQTQIDYQSQANRVVALEEEIDSQRSKSGMAASGRLEVEAARKECESLREQLKTLRLKSDSARAGGESSFIGQRSLLASPSRAKWQLTDATTRLEKVTSDKKALQDELVTVKADLRKSQTALAEVKAERDELDASLKRSTASGDSLRVDQERLNLRTSKLKSDNEVRRLKDENRTLLNQRQLAEKSLEDEIEKAAAEEERLSQEILELQSKLRQGSSDANDASSRRAMRDLERQVEDYKAQLAEAHLGMAGDNGEVSIIRRDLSAARQKEINFLQQESTNKELIKDLRREIASLESKLHDNQISKLGNTPSKAVANHNPTALLEEVQTQLNDIEDQKLLLEELLEEAHQEAEEASAQHQTALQQLQHKLAKAERERDANSAFATTTDKQSRHLRKSQAEIENLEHDILQQQKLIESLSASEATLRRKLERARSERATYRSNSDKLHRQIQRLQTGVEHRRLVAANDEAEHALETVVRAADSAQERHKKELRGMVMQMEWMQARWEREASLRSDAAFAKNFVQLQLNVANACNKAQLRELEHIRTKILHSKKPLPASTSSSFASSYGSANKPTLKTFMVMARFIARTKIGAKSWARQEVVRKKLVAATEERKRVKRGKQLRVVEVDA